MQILKGTEMVNLARLGTFIAFIGQGGESKYDLYNGKEGVFVFAWALITQINQ